jgi:UPF0042 nucleotide-binding protein
MRIVVLTGLSGSGKTTALRALEDLGYYAIDNLPVRLMDRLVELFVDESADFERLTVVVDARSVVQRSPDALDVVPMVLANMRAAGHDVEVVFLDAASDVLERRYSETRRRHPLSTDGSVRDGIQRERTVLEPLRLAANWTIDSSKMSVHELRRTMLHAFGEPGGQHRMSVTVLSFGFKYGLPPEADLVLDVRFLKNPHFVEQLRPLTGRDAPVAEFVLEQPAARTFLDKTEDLVGFLLPQYEREGKAYLTLAVGCTGGRHRSVALALELERWLAERGVRVHVRHRDVDR